MEIMEEQNSKPVSMKPYRTSEQERRHIAEIIEEWVKSGIISETRSPYASPVILVNKANGKKRLCVDFRRLNSQTISQPYPMPDVDSQLSSLSAGKIFCTSDLSYGYLQIALVRQRKTRLHLSLLMQYISSNVCLLGTRYWELSRGKVLFVLTSTMLLFQQENGETCVGKWKEYFKLLNVLS